MIPIACARKAHDGSLSALPPLSLYVHYPWCRRKCPYCDFNSHPARGDVPEEDYLAALLRDLEAALPDVWGRNVVSIFIGGGTPSLLSVAAVERLLAALRARLPLLPEAEITLEANPGAMEEEKFGGFRQAGVTRLSLGVQSFDDRKLAALGRIHSAAEARRAADEGRRHFPRLNLDLMYALPGQTLEEAGADLAAALAHGPDHLSAYHLTIEADTAFHRSPPPLPDDDLAADMQELVEATLAAAGYGHYETSAFALAGARCRHNLNYWTYGDYLGIGPGAHSKLSSPTRIVREARPRRPRDWLADPAKRSWQEVPLAERGGEFMMNALRLIDGFEARLFEERTGLSLASIGGALKQAEQEGLLTTGPLRIGPTLLGQRHLNALIGRFL